jgi:transcriptional regulator with XRE-family HTH domain
MQSKRRATSDAVAAVPLLEAARGGRLSLGEIIAEARRVDEMSLAGFAARLGISRAHLCDIEKGRRGVSAARAAEWAKALHLTPERLVAAALQAQLDDAGIRCEVALKPSSRRSSRR